MKAELVEHLVGGNHVEGPEESHFLSEQVVIDLFTTAIPFSAAVERVLSIGKDIFRAKGVTLSEDNSERLMYMKGNQHHVETMEEVSWQDTYVILYHFGSFNTIQ